jgi:hypothetical protein
MLHCSSIIFLVPNTMHCTVLTRLEQSQPAAAAAITEAAEIKANPPKWRAPWVCMWLILDKRIVLHALLGLLTYCPSYAYLVLLSAHLAKAPYNFSPGFVGLSFVPNFAAAFVAAPIGGIIFDRAAAAHPGNFMARLKWNNAAALLLPLAVMLGVTGLQLHWHLAIVFAAQAVVGATAAVYYASLLSYLTCVHQHAASSASAGFACAFSLFCGLMVSTAVAGDASIGMIGFFGIVIGITMVVGVAAAVQICKHRVARMQGEIEA